MARKLTEEQVREILETYRWIKVKRFVDDPTLSAEERFKRLEEHHNRETTFLIDFVRELVRDV